jgi:hypothetical protein
MRRLRIKFVIFTGGCELKFRILLTIKNTILLIKNTILLTIKKFRTFLWEVGWHHVRSAPCTWRRGAWVSWLSLKTKVDGL